VFSVLTLQRLQLRFDEPRLELCRVHRPRFGFAAIRQRVADADEKQIRHQQPVELRQILQQRKRDPAGEVRRRAFLPHEQVPHAHHHDRVHDRVGQRAAGVQRDLTRPVRAIDRVSKGERHDGRREQRRDVPVDQVEGEQMQHRVLHRMRVRCELVHPVRLESG